MYSRLPHKKHHKKKRHHEEEYYGLGVNTRGMHSVAVGGGFNDALDEVVDFLFHNSEGQDSYDHMKNNSEPNPNPKPPKPQPKPSPTPDNNPNYDPDAPDYHGRGNLPHNVTWSREKSAAVAATVLAGGAATVLAKQGAAAGKPPIGFDPRADDPEEVSTPLERNIEMANMDADANDGFANMDGEGRESQFVGQSLSDDIDEAARDQLSSAEYDDFTRGNRGMARMDNVNYEPIDNADEIQGFDGIEEEAGDAFEEAVEGEGGIVATPVIMAGGAIYRAAEGQLEDGEEEDVKAKAQHGVSAAQVGAVAIGDALGDEVKDQAHDIWQDIQEVGNTAALLNGEPAQGATANISQELDDFDGFNEAVSNVVGNAFESVVHWFEGGDDNGDDNEGDDEEPPPEKNDAPQPNYNGDDGGD